MTRQEMADRGWDACDIILVTGDAYVDHPSFGAPLIGRYLESLGYRVGIIAQPDPEDIETFRALGPPRLCWGVAAGNIDSMLMRNTIMRRPRRDDAYTPGGQAGKRPANASIVYASRVRQAYKGIPVILGGVEASLRRFAYYDYWTGKIKRSMLFDAKADLIAFGMAERAMGEIMRRLDAGEPLHDIPGTAEARAQVDDLTPRIDLPSYDDVAAPTAEGKQAYARMARETHLHTDPADAHALVQRYGERYLVVHPPAEMLSPAELDDLYALPFTRRPHPAYGDVPIPAYEMIKDSITTHRGCYGGCSFCAIGAHQGTRISSRSPKSVLAEITAVAKSGNFNGTISDLGGPTANMYGTRCTRGYPEHCPRRSGRSCLYPRVCKYLDTDHSAALSLLRSAREHPRVKHVFISSGIRADLAQTPGGRGYVEALVQHHVGGRLKIAPEHIVPNVLAAMHKPEPQSHREFLNRYRVCCERAGKSHQVIEYFISGHPGCTLHDMIALAQYIKRARFAPEQVQDFYPVPLTLAAAMYYTGLDPLTMEPVHVATGDGEKAMQRALLLCHKPEFHAKAREALRRADRDDLIGNGPNCLVPAEHGHAPSGRPAKTPPRPQSGKQRKRRR